MLDPIGVVFRGPRRCRSRLAVQSIHKFACENAPVSKCRVFIHSIHEEGETVLVISPGLSVVFELIRCLIAENEQMSLHWICLPRRAGCHKVKRCHLATIDNSFCTTSSRWAHGAVTPIPTVSICARCFRNLYASVPCLIEIVLPFRFCPLPVGDMRLHRRCHDTCRVDKRASLVSISVTRCLRIPAAMPCFGGLRVLLDGHHAPSRDYIGWYP